MGIKPFFFSYMGPNMGTPIYDGPRQKRFFYSYMGAIYGGVFPIYVFFYMGKVVSHMPLFSYMGAVSFLNFHFEKNFNILDICVFNYYASKKGSG